MELRFCTHSVLGVTQVMNYKCTIPGGGISPNGTNLCYCVFITVMITNFVLIKNGILVLLH